MKQFKFLFVSLILFVIPFSLNSQDEKGSADSGFMPLIDKMSAFGMERGDVYAAIKYISFEGEDVVTYFLNFGLSGNFNLSVGTLSQGFTDPLLIYVDPQFSLLKSTGSNLAISLKHILPDDFDLGNSIANPSIFYTIGDARKYFTFGYSFLYDYNSKDFSANSFGDLFESIAGLRFDARVPVSQDVFIITHNGIVPDAEFTNSTIWVNLLGVEYSITRANFYFFLKNFFFFGDNSDSTTRVGIGVNFRFNK